MCVCKALALTSAGAAPVSHSAMYTSLIQHLQAFCSFSSITLGVLHCFTSSSSLVCLHSLVSRSVCLRFPTHCLPVLLFLCLISLSFYCFFWPSSVRSFLILHHNTISFKLYILLYFPFQLLSPTIMLLFMWPSYLPSFFYLPLLLFSLKLHLFLLKLFLVSHLSPLLCFLIWSFLLELCITYFHLIFFLFFTNLSIKINQI